MGASKPKSMARGRAEHRESNGKNKKVVKMGGGAGWRRVGEN